MYHNKILLKNFLIIILFFLIISCAKNDKKLNNNVIASYQINGMVDDSDPANGNNFELKGNDHLYKIIKDGESLISAEVLDGKVFSLSSVASKDINPGSRANADIMIIKQKEAVIKSSKNIGITFSSECKVEIQGRGNTEIQLYATIKEMNTKPTWPVLLAYSFTPKDGNPDILIVKAGVRPNTVIGEFANGQTFIHNFSVTNFYNMPKGKYTIQYKIHTHADAEQYASLQALVTADIQ